MKDPAQMGRMHACACEWATSARNGLTSSTCGSAWASVVSDEAPQFPSGIGVASTEHGMGLRFAFLILWILGLALIWGESVAFASLGPSMVACLIAASDRRGSSCR